MKKLIALALMLSLGFVTGCGAKPAEAPKAKEAVKKVEEAVKDATKKVEDAAKKVEEATKDAVKKVEEGAKKAEEAVKDAAKAVTPPAEPAAPKIEVPKDAPKASPEAKKE